MKTLKLIRDKKKSLVNSTSVESGGVFGDLARTVFLMLEDIEESLLEEFHHGEIKRQRHNAGIHETSSDHQNATGSHAESHQPAQPDNADLG